MGLLQISEIFGNDTAISIPPSLRNSCHCPFKGTPCTKQGKTNPIGICSYTDGHQATVVCPSRFLEGNRIFRDAARIAFGEGKDFVAIPEVRVLEIKDAEKSRKIGKVDFLLALLEGPEVVDFAAMEVQAVYMSGKSIRPAFQHYLRTGELTGDSQRRSDFRSSGPKRLMPQLALKVPIFSRWGKRFFVVTDAVFFADMPRMKAQSGSNSEVTWLSYSIERDTQGYHMLDPTVVHTLWVDVEYALREGEAPEQSEMLRFLAMKAVGRQIFKS